MCVVFITDSPEENAWPVADEEKVAAKWGARSAECAAGSAIARSDRQPISRCLSILPSNPDSLLASFDIDGEARALGWNESRLTWKCETFLA
jgi:hypothetical protein